MGLESLEKHMDLKANTKVFNLIIRFFKGLLIGVSFILPGISGGAIAAVFGIYERIISFIANITKNFKENFIYFLPIGIGGLTGVFCLSSVIEVLFDSFEKQTLWFFIGCIIGTFPMLWKKAGEKSRKSSHVILMIAAFIFSGLFLFYGQQVFNEISQNTVTWMIAGALIGLGVIIPGLSPSNLLIYMKMYVPMANAIKTFDFPILIPIAIGFIVCLFAFSKLMNMIFQKAYAALFHFILGVVLASVIAIVPFGSYNPFEIVSCVLITILGLLCGYFMGKLEEKYK